MLLLVSALWLAPAVPAPPALLQAGGASTCPDVRACDVDARVVEQGTARTCGIGLTLFGLDLSLGGDDCHPTRLTYPAHQECHGKRNVGTYCAWEQTLSVSSERCECSRLGFLGTGVALPDCVCTPNGTAGTIDDYQTRNCAEAPVGGSNRSGGGGPPARGGGS